MSTSTSGQDPAEVAGPFKDGSLHLARESKFGQVGNYLASALALSAASLLGDLDIGGLPEWVIPIVGPAIGTAVGMLVAYGTRNRPPVKLKRLS